MYTQSNVLEQLPFGQIRMSIGMKMEYIFTKYDSESSNDNNLVVWAVSRFSDFPILELIWLRNAVMIDLFSTELIEYICIYDGVMVW